MFSCLSKFLTFVLVLGSSSLLGCLAEMGSEDGGNLGDLGVVGQEISFGGHDYLFVTTPKPWHEAQTYCYNYNGGIGYHLVTVNSDAEEQFLDRTETALGISNWWIGYTDEGIEGSWIWPNDYSNHVNWVPGEPSNSDDEDCAVDRWNGADGWNDLNCNISTVFICERGAGPPLSRGSFAYSATRTNDAMTGTTNVAVNLAGGVVFTVGTCGLTGATGTGDTYLRLYDSGMPLASNDDACGLGSKRSNISIVVPANGTYVISAGCHADTACSGTVAWSY